jgi:four helix bundle protein
MNNIHSFTDLVAWREAHKLAILIYKETKKFPKEELFGLVIQMRRAAVSVSSNTAEGFSRNSYIDKNRFYAMAQGSVTELQNQLLIARDVGYMAKQDFGKLAEQSILAHKLINGLIKSSKDKILNA